MMHCIFKTTVASLSLLASSSHMLCHLLLMQLFPLKLHLRFMHSRKLSGNVCHPASVRTLTYTCTQSFSLFSKLQFLHLFALVTFFLFFLGVCVSVSVPMCVTKGCVLVCCVLMWVYRVYELLKDRTGGSACFIPFTFSVMQFALWKTAPNSVCKDDEKWSLLQLHNYMII